MLRYFISLLNSKIDYLLLSYKGLPLLYIKFLYYRRELGVIPPRLFDGGAQLRHKHLYPPSTNPRRLDSLGEA